MAEDDDYRKYTTMRDASAALVMFGLLCFFVFGGALGPLGFVIALLALILPGILLGAKAKRIRPK